MEWDLTCSVSAHTHASFVDFDVMVKFSFF